jgi:diguanylate cyclase (GGDEF)-like protein
MIKVLIIDDEPVIRDLFARMLSGEGYEIFQADSGAAGIQLIQDQPIDIAFIDLNMPAMDGITTVKEIRKSNKTIVLALMTGTTNMREGMKGLRQGASDYLSKPFDISQVRAIIEKHVGGMRSVSTQMFEQARQNQDALSLALLQRTSINILVVDDEEELRYLLRRVLLDEGYTVDEAKDGLEATAKLKCKRYDLVITDMSMPRADGIEVLKKAKELSEQTDVILLTGFGTLETAQQAIHLGACDYFLKPVPNIKDIVRSADRVLQKQFLVQENARLMAEVKKNVFELGVLFETSKAISYTLDYNQLVDLIMSSLHKICAYDLAGSLILGAEKHRLNLYAARPFPENLLDEAKKNLCETAESLTEQKIDAASFHESFQMIQTPEQQEEGPIRPLKSSFSIPLMIEEKIVGVMNVSSFRLNAFSTDQIKLLYTVSNQMALALSRLHRLINQEKTKMDAMVTSMGEGVLMTDERGDLIIVNPAAREMLEFTEDQKITPHDLKERYGALHMDTIRVRGINHAEEEEEEEEEEEVEIPGETPRTLHISQKVVKDGKGNSLGYVTLLRDITAQKNLDRLKDEFMSVVSHELRTPLTIIKGAVSNLRDHIVGDLTLTQDKVVKVACDNADRLARLINDILDLSRLESGKSKVQRTCVQTVALLDEVVNAFQPQAKAKELILEADVTPNTPDLYVDADMIHQLLSNLLSNSLRFAKSSIILKTVPTDNHSIEIIVGDDGPGIAPDDARRLFNKFEQIHRPQGGSGYKGTGLGLTICKEIVERHKGKIWMTSRVGQGSEFHVTLPRYNAEEDFQEALKEMMLGCQENGQGLSVLALSINNVRELKRHCSEKERLIFLAEIGERIQKQALRAEDRIFHQSSKEYLVIMAGTKRDGAQSIKKRIQREIKECYCNTKTGKVIPSVSVGIAVYPDEASDGKQLVEMALKEAENEARGVARIA